MKSLALSGSLRNASLNSAVVRTTTRLSPPGVTMEIYEGIGTLPFFHQDVESEQPPAEVPDFRSWHEAADAVLVSSPEYAHGTSGVLKHALEWVVGGGGLVGEPVAVVTASPSMTGGERAQAWVRKTLEVMGAPVLPERLPVACAGAKLSDGRVTDESPLADLRNVLGAMARAAKELNEA
ncbi:NADPH-dependent FMN reductase [Streptomyces sennicomposti]|uniref:NADPH-dependent FMN reductase n=1 Tax=Streptomyces sennicomposti TaxID=2873384 RepID=UPI001CA72E35|nr:NADPH-dependent FMN reductase [Streptomyces sennicomposti]MBY8864509.1 NAD(P)H-dependent oxidoreductase [Streptomyces sennicomposti]